MTSNATPPSYSTAQSQAQTTSNTQQQYNKDAAITQAELNQTNQVTPYGNLTYQQIGTNADGTPRFQATQTLSPQNQQLYDQYMSLAGKYGTTGNALMDNVSSMYSTPFNLDQATNDKVTGFQNEFLNQQWDRNQNQLIDRLANQGITPGSQAYNDQMTQFNNQRQQAYDQSYLDTYKTAAQMATQQRQEPLTELAAFSSGTQPQGMQFTTTPQENVGAADYTGAVNSNFAAQNQTYQNQLAQNNAMMGGLFGLAGTAAKAYFMV